MKKKKSVLVAMSGGVDSSVAAHILKEKGYEVIGATMKLWQEEGINNKNNGCCSISSVEDARKVASLLDIPFYVINFKGIFKEKVIDYFISEYMKAKTPNPCIACNKYIKFESFLQKAIELNIDYIATGHYSIIEYDNFKKRFLLKKSIDQTKDQSYALSYMTQYQLEKTIFPLGGFKKYQVRKIAENIKLEIANKPDSQEICFVTDNDYQSFIERNSNNKIETGSFIDKAGNILGKHKGISHYTIGQRKGLGLALGKPQYIINIDKSSNEIMIGDKKDLYKRSFIVSNTNFIPFDKLNNTLEVKTKIRYNFEEKPALITPLKNNKNLKVEFKKPQKAITPGQIAVFYHNDIVVGGGEINKLID